LSGFIGLVEHVRSRHKQVNFGGENGFSICDLNKRTKDAIRPICFVVDSGGGVGDR